MKKVCVYKQQPNRNIPCPYIKVSPKNIPIAKSYTNRPHLKKVTKGFIKVESEDTNHKNKNHQEIERQWKQWSKKAMENIEIEI